MNTLIVVPSLILAGAEMQAVNLANGLAARGHSTHFCCFGPPFDLRDRLSADVEYHLVSRSSKFDLSVISRLARIIDSNDIDIVLGVMEFATLIAWLAASRSGGKPPVLAAIHTTVQRGLKQDVQDRLIYRGMLRRLPAVVFVCEHQRTYWVQKFPELAPLSAVVHNGVDPAHFRRDDFREQAAQLRTALGIADDTVLFAHIAAFRPEKGHKLLIDVFSQLDGDACLVFAGDGELRPVMEAHVATAGLKERTRFLGNIADVRPLIAASNATVLASTAVETFSMAMLESMAMGVPMIAPHIGGLPEAIIHGDTGLLFAVGDSPALARCLQQVLDKPEDAARMGRSAEHKVTQRFTDDAMVKGTERVLLDVLNRTRGQ